MWLFTFHRFTDGEPGSFLLKVAGSPLERGSKSGASASPHHEQMWWHLEIPPGWSPGELTRSSESKRERPSAWRRPGTGQSGHRNPTTGRTHPTRNLTSIRINRHQDWPVSHPQKGGRGFSRQDGEEWRKMITHICALSKLQFMTELLLQNKMEKHIIPLNCSKEMFISLMIVV